MDKTKHSLKVEGNNNDQVIDSQATKIRDERS
jgi:hypothetical protein